MEKKINELIRNFYNNDGIVRSKARSELLEIGRPIVDFMVGLQYAPYHQVRWEAIKTLSQLAVPEAIPILINALENEDMDIRWLAAHGLVQIGRDSVKSVLEAIEGNQNSKYLRDGAHHVLKDLQHRHLFNDQFNILKMLGHYGSHSKLAFTATKILLEMTENEPVPKTAEHN